MRFGDKILLSNGQIALIDEEDFEYLNQWSWSVNKDGAVYRIENLSKCSNCGKHSQTTIYLHREVMRARKHEVVDHIFHNKLDNRKENLRLCSQQCNTFNQRKQKTNRTLTSKFKGVHFDKDNNKWRAGIRYNNKMYYLGRYITEVEAALAYNEKAKELFGDFAFLNNVTGES